MQAGTTCAAAITPITFLNDQHTAAILTCGSDSVTVQRPNGFEPDAHHESLGPWSGDDGYSYTLVVNPKGNGYDVHNSPSDHQPNAASSGYQLAPHAVEAVLTKVYSQVPQALTSLGLSSGYLPTSTPRLIISQDTTIAAGSFGTRKQFLLVSAGVVSKGGDILTASLTYAVSTQIVNAYPALLDQASDAQSVDRVALALSGHNSALLIALLEAAKKQLAAVVSAPVVSPPPSAHQANSEVQSAMGRLMAKLQDPMDKMAFAKVLRKSVASGNTADIEQFAVAHPVLSGDPDLKSVEGAIDPHGTKITGMPAGGITHRGAPPVQIMGGEHVPANAFPADLLSNLDERPQLLGRM